MSKPLTRPLHYNSTGNTEHKLQAALKKHGLIDGTGAKTTKAFKMTRLAYLERGLVNQSEVDQLDF